MAKYVKALSLLFFVCIVSTKLSAQTVFADSQTNSTSITCLGCTVANPDQAVDGDESTASTISTTLGLLGGTAEQTLIFPQAGSAGDTVEIMMESGEALLSLNLLGGVEVTSFNGATSNNDTKLAADVSVSLLGNNKFIFTFYPTADFDRVQVLVRVPVASLLGSFNIYFARIFKESNKSALTTCTPPDDVSTTVFCPLLGALLQTCDVLNPGAVLSPDPTDYATISLQADLLAKGGIGVSYDDPACVNDSLNIFIERPGAVAAADLLGGNVTINAFRNGANVFSEQIITQNLQAISFSSSIYKYEIGPGVEFDSVSVDMAAGLLGLLTELRVYNFCLRRQAAPRPDPNLGTMTRACFDEDLVINWQVPNGTQIKVFTDRNLTNLVHQGNPTFVAQNLTMDTTFYVQSFDPLVNCSSALIDSIVIDVLDPIQPAIEETFVTCYNESARLTPKPNGGMFAFYADTNDAPIFVGGAFVTDELQNDTIFWVKNTIDNFCFEDEFHQIDVKIFEEPQAPDISDSLAICEGDASPLAVFMNSEDVTGVNVIYNVFDRDDNFLTSFVFPDTAFIPRSLLNLNLAGDRDTIYVDALSNLGGCRESANKKMVIVKVVEPTDIPVPVADTLYFCDNDTSYFTLTNVVRGVDYIWRKDSADGEIAFVGDSIPVANSSDTLKFFIESRLGACASATIVEAVAVPVSKTTSNFTALDQIICIGDQAELIAMSDIPGVSYTWFGSATELDTLSISDTLLTDPIFESDTTFYLKVNGLKCINTDRYPANVSTTTPPTVTVDRTGYYLCEGDSVVLMANNSDVSGNGSISWWSTATGETGFVSDANPFVINSADLITDVPNIYYAQADVDRCPSGSRVPVIVQKLSIDSTAMAGILPSSDSLCTGESAVLMAQPQSPNIIEVEFSWWDASTGGNKLSTSDVFTTQPLNSSTSFYAQIEFVDNVCAGVARAEQMITVVDPLPEPQNVTCADTDGNKVGFVWDAVPGAVSYEVTYTIEDQPSTTQITTNTNIEFPGLSQGETVTILVKAVGALECQLSNPGYASCTAGCPPNNSELNQVLFEICQNETAEIIINLDPTLPADIVNNIRIGIIGQPGESQNLRYIFPDDFAGQPDFDQPMNGQYQDTILFYVAYPQDIEGCDSLVLPAIIKVNPVPNIDPDAAIEVIPLVPPVVGQIVDEFQFISNIPGDTDWLWNFGDGTTSSERNPVHKFPLSDTPYQVSLSVSNAFGCQSTADYNRLITVSSVPEIFIPTTFTPNGDGKNDLFRVFGEGITLDDFKVFNKFGNVIFETDNINEAWDGTNDGEPVMGGTYYYTMIINDFLGNKYEREGTVTVIRN